MDLQQIPIVRVGMPGAAIPTIFLKWTSPSEVVEKYSNGFFSQVQFPDKKFTVKSGEILVPKYDADFNKGIFSFRDNSNNQIIIATTNQESYSQYTGDGGIYANSTPEDPCECEWCRFGIKPGTLILGIPIEYHIEMMTKYEFVQDGESFKMKPVTYERHVFLTEGRHDDFACALAHIRGICSPDWIFRKTRYDEAEANLKAMFSLLYPGVPFPDPARHYRLLKRNGGSLSMDQWRSASFTFIESPVVTQVPVKTHFQRM